MNKQLFIYCDMEGASQITEENREALCHGSLQWRTFGKDCITSDVKAVCAAAVEFGIDDILIYDGHYAGNPEPNVRINELHKIARFVEVPDRCIDWRRIRGQIQSDSYGMVFVGQHAPYGTENAYFAHTIQPRFKELTLNGFSIAEIGSALYNLQGIKFLANIGDQASMPEANALCPKVMNIPVKDKFKKWVPPKEETYKIIKERVIESLVKRDFAPALNVEGPFIFTLSLLDNVFFEIPANFSWKGYFEKHKAYWEAPSAEIGLEILWFVTQYIKK